MKRNVDLALWAPWDVIGKAREFDARVKSENKEFNLLWAELERVQNAAFIFKTNSKTIKYWEEMLGISPRKDASLSDRQRKVYIEWNKRVKWTHRTFLKWLDVYLGKGNYKLSLDYDKYGIEIDVIIKESLYFDLEDLQRQVRNIIPANLTQFIRIKFIRDQKIFYGMYGQKVKKITIMAVKPEDRVFNLPTYYGIGEVRKRLKRRARMPDVWTVDDVGMMKEIGDGSEVDMKYDR
ncbi:putative phage tail protein [Peptoniphilus harei]|uniref:putative phage tail protein n=1 Tax=Peptoniphilus harei TaxID=54005 RepID=UPI0011DD2DEB|nr:putative phage tail protein [Peptoniphilus harei]